MKLKPCPFCGSENLEEDYGAVAELNPDEQSGNVECLDCGAKGPYITVVGDEVYETGCLPGKVREAWDKRK